MPIIKQLTALVLGLLGAAIMTGLGVWQLGKYQAQGSEQVRARAASSPVALDHVAKPGKDPTGDAFYRPVRLSGHYDTSLQRLLPTDDQGKSRVLTAFILDSGGAVPVVRGTTSHGSAPHAPSGRIHQTGLLLPSEGEEQSSKPAGEPTVVNLAALTQSWKPSLVGGFVTLGDQQARDQSLTPAQVELPRSSGRVQNGAYALQWWVFAAFSIAMGVKMAHDIRKAATADEADDPGILTPDPEPDHTAVGARHADAVTGSARSNQTHPHPESGTQPTNGGTRT